MEYTCMEIVHGALASRAAFATPDTHSAANGAAAAQQCAWDEWMYGLVAARWANASKAKYPIWANMLARAMRHLANELTGVEQFAPELQASKDAVADALMRTCDSVCELARASRGKSSTDAKCALLLRYTIDHMTQAQAVQRDATIAAVLRKLALQAAQLADSGRQHPLQAVRASCAALVPHAYALLRSRVPLLPSSQQGDEVMDTDVASQHTAGRSAVVSAASLDALVQDAFDSARTALSEANAARASSSGAASASSSAASEGNGAVADEGNGVAADTVGTVPADVARWEAALGYAAALTRVLHGIGPLEPMLLDVLLPAVPWAVEAQGLEHPGLSSTITLLRSSLGAPSSRVCCAIRALPPWTPGCTLTGSCVDGSV